jgi:hypothetical protein
MTKSNWYILSANGIATLCASQADAIASAKDADASWPREAPHMPVQLVDANAAPRWHAGEPANIQAALADADQWLLLIELLHTAGKLPFSDPASTAKLAASRAALRRFLGPVPTHEVDACKPQ